MFRRSSAISYIALVVLGLIGAWLTGLFERTNRAHEVSGGELFAAFVGFFIFLGALLGIVLLIRRNIRPWTDEHLSQWESIRKRGRSAYIREAIIKGLVVALLALSWPLITDYWKTRSLSLILDSAWIYTALFLTCVFGMYYAALRTWSANEKHYENRIHQMEPKT